MTWTDERIELLKKLWSDGLSASAIAAELGGITRNAIIGRVHRLGLSGRAKSPSSAAPQPRKARERKIRIARPTVRADTALETMFEPEPLPDEPELIIPIGQRRDLAGLTADTCHWPVGDPCGEDFFFCGGNAAPGLPYCAYHSRIAYRAASPRRERPPFHS